MPKDGFNMMSNIDYARLTQPPPHGVWWMLLVSTPKTTHTFDSGFPKQQYQGSNNRQADRSLEFNSRGIVCKLFNKGFCIFGKKM
jgi:hypothetical protein